MTDSDILELLRLWWETDRRAALVSLGYPRVCPSAREYRAGYTGDDALNDDGFAAERAALCSMIEKAVESLPSTLRSHAYMLARNEAISAGVFSSGRVMHGLGGEAESAVINALRNSLDRSVKEAV